MPTPKPGILDIAPYVGGKSSLRGRGEVVKLSSNESALGASPAVAAALQEVAATAHRYPDGHARVLRNALGERWSLDPARIVCGAGSDELIGLLCQAYAGAGDEVLYSAHGFLMYAIYARSFGATPVAAPERNLTADVDALLAAVTPRTRIVFLANPNNPTGSYLPRAEIARLREGLRPDILLVLDNAYAEYVDPETTPDYDTGEFLVDAGDNTVTTRTFSKIYGLGGLRIGWCYAPEAVADVLNRVRGPFNISAPAIAAGAAAVQDTAFEARARAHNTAQRARLAAALEELGLRVSPSLGNFLLVHFPEAGAHTAAGAETALAGQGILVRNVANYGLPHALRITIGLAEENEAVARRLEQYMGGR